MPRRKRFKRLNDPDGLKWSIDEGLKDGLHPVISDGDGNVVAVVYSCGLVSPTMVRARGVAAVPKMMDLLRMVALGNTEYDDLSKMAQELLDKIEWGRDGDSMRKKEAARHA